MKLAVTPKRKEKVKAGPMLQQTGFWGKVKEIQGCKVRAFDMRFSCPVPGDDMTARGLVATDILVILRSLGSGLCMAHVPYGPEFEPPRELQGCFLEELSEALRKHLPDQCLFIRYDLPWESPWAGDRDRYSDTGTWLGPPREEIQEIRMNIDTRTRNLRKSPTNVLPANTVFLNLRKEKGKLLKQMKAKTRYNIRLAGRKGVRIVEGDRRKLDAWYRLYSETARRNNIVLHDKRYFHSMLEANEKFDHPDVEMHLLLAEAEGDLLAGMFLAFSEKQAVYLYGASSQRKSNRMGTYALQWEAINRARQSGCRYYDMFGVAPSPEPSHPMYGLYRFKTGFGGELYHRQGCWDYPLVPEEYGIYRAVELNDSGFHLRN
jgi:lipid II:glycine glycyltransferase (peptidoglycan interpeptide bridge formation enzyme)